jgi:hypothetical protein
VLAITLAPRTRQAGWGRTVDMGLRHKPMATVYGMNVAHAQIP